MTNDEAIEIIDCGEISNRWGKDGEEVERMAIEALRQKPSISEDGTLTVNVEDGSKVSRVLVCGDNHFGGLYYPEQEPCDKCVYSTSEGCQYDDITETIPLFEDCISRQAVLDVTWEEPSYTDALNVLTEVRDKVKALPPVNPQKPKIGYWIFVDKAKEHARCSECGYGDIDLFNGKPHNYCEKCGVKMESEVQE